MSRAIYCFAHYLNNLIIWIIMEIVQRLYISLFLCVNSIDKDYISLSPLIISNFFSVGRDGWSRDVQGVGCSGIRSSRFESQRTQDFLCQLPNPQRRSWNKYGLSSFHSLKQLGLLLLLPHYYSPPRWGTRSIVGSPDSPPNNFLQLAAELIETVSSLSTC